MPVGPTPITIYRSTVLLDKDSDTITLPRPILGDSDVRDNFVENHETLQGKLILFKRTEAPKTRTFELTFDKISQTVLDALLTFVNTYLGQQITYTDMEDIEHTVILMNPQFRAITLRESICTEYEVTLNLLKVES